MKSRLLKKEAVIILLSALLLSLGFQNCSQLGSSDAKSSQSTKAGFSEQDLMLQKSLLILQTNCASCHNSEIKTNGVNVTSLDEMLSVGVIVVNEPILSPLMQVLLNPTVAEHGTLKQKDLNTLTQWISEGFKDGATGGEVVGAVPIPLGPSWKSLNQNIISRRCTGCHNSVTLSGGRSFTTYAGVRAIITPAQPNQSLFYQRIAGLPRANGTIGAIMPLGRAPLTPDELAAFSAWITAGANEN